MFYIILYRRLPIDFYIQCIWSLNVDYSEAIHNNEQNFKKQTFKQGNKKLQK